MIGEKEFMLRHSGILKAKSRSRQMIDEFKDRYSNQKGNY